MALLASFSNTLKLAGNTLEVGAIPRKIVTKKNGNLKHFEKISNKGLILYDPPEYMIEELDLSLIHISEPTRPY